MTYPRSFQRFSSGRSSLIGLVLCFLLALGLLAYPVYVIRPFRYQGPHELLIALAVLRVRTLLDIVLFALAVGFFVNAWRTQRRVVARIAAVFCAVMVAACGVLSRINIYEMMFNPLSRISFSAASQAKLDKEEEVIAVKVRTAARAYPIRSMSYHHIVNDVVAGEPIVATY